MEPNTSGEGKEQNLCSIIRRNLCQIVKQTKLNCEFTNYLHEKDLIVCSEYERLNSYLKDGLHSEGATYLFTLLPSKLSKANENNLIEALQVGKNESVLEILRRPVKPGTNELTETEGRFFLSLFNTAEVEFLRGFEDRTFTSEGNFEGLHLEDEVIANKLLNERGTGWTLMGAEGVVLTVGEKWNFFGSVKETVRCLGQGSLWWNKHAARLAPNFIQRRVHKLPVSSEEEETSSEEDEDEELKLSEVANEPFVWLSDPPGMGKSTVTTKLEKDWRKSMPSNRLIIRINLNIAQHSLPKEENLEEDGFSLVSFLKRFVPYIPLDLLSRLPGGQVKVILLLDGLDEVSNIHDSSMLRILNSLIVKQTASSADRKFISLVLRRPQMAEKILLHKVFLTTRPHLRSLIEEEFKVNAHSLLPLNFDEQSFFLSQEVSEVAEFTQGEAAAALSSLPSSARSLMGNPLMLFLFAQVIKLDGGSGVIDLFHLYQRFVEAKHWLHVVEKEVADPEDLKTEWRVRNFLEDNLPHYYAVALAQLKHSGTDWPGLIGLPEGAKREELLSYGLLLSSSSRFQFIHLSFAEFFYARLLTVPSTPIPLRDSLFRHLYSLRLSNVEEFVVRALKKRAAEFPFERLLPLSKEWLAQLEDKTNPLLWFLRGELFSLLGEEVLAFSIHLDDPKVIDTLIDASLRSDYKSGNRERLRRWLCRRDPDWTRSTLLRIPPFAPISWDIKTANLVAVLLLADPEGLRMSLSDGEIRSALISSDSLPRIVCVMPKGRLERKAEVESRLGREMLRGALMSENSLKASLKWKEAAWWMAELLTKEQICSLLSNNESRVTDLIGVKPAVVAAVWGEEFLGDLLKFRFKFGERNGRSVFEGEGRGFAMEKLRGWLEEGEESLAVLREAIHRSQDWTLLEKLEEQAEGKSEGVNFKRDANLVQRVVGSEENCLWNQMNDLPFHFLPYVIRYGKLYHVKKLFPTHSHLDFTFYSDIQSISTSLVLALLAEENTEGTFKYVVSLVRSSLFERSLRAQEHMDVLSFFLTSSVNELRKAVSSSFPNCQGPLVRQVSWGEVLLRLLPTATVKIKEESIKAAVRNFLKKTRSCEVSEVLSPLLRTRPSLRQFIFNEIVTEASGHPKSGEGIAKKRLQNLLRFLLQSNKLNDLWISQVSSLPFLMNLISEIGVCDPQCVSLGEASEVKCLLCILEERLRSLFVSNNMSCRDLLKLFVNYRSEEEWSWLLWRLRLIPRNVDFRNESHVYEEPAVAFLRVWLRNYGVEETRRVAETEALLYYKLHLSPWHLTINTTGLEAVLLAVELGSLKMLEQLAQPSLLGWRDKDGRSFLEVADVKWGPDHGVTKFVKQKLKLTFMESSNNAANPDSSGQHKSQ